VSRREDIDSGIWSDPDFEALSLEATSLYLWSFTNPRCGMAGLYKVSRRAMGESKVPDDQLDDTLAELAAADFLYYQGGVMFVRTRVKHMRQKTEQIAKSIRSDLQKVADGHPLKQKFLGMYEGMPWLRRFLTPDEVSVNGPPTDGPALDTVEPSRQTLPSPSTGGRSTPKGNGKGSGTGTGRGQGYTDTDARARREAWASEHLPDLPVEFVVAIAERLGGSGRPLVAAEVRRMVIANYPTLQESA
jgi:hypothetical protein